MAQSTSHYSSEKKKGKVTLYLLNLNVSSFSAAKAGVSVRIENANVLGGWSRSYSKLVLCLGEENISTVTHILYISWKENGSGITTNVFKNISLCCKICKGILNRLLGSD